MHSVSIQNLDLSFGAVDVLQGLNLDIHDGEFLVLLGSAGGNHLAQLYCRAVGHHGRFDPHQR